MTSRIALSSKKMDIDYAIILSQVHNLSHTPFKDPSEVISPESVRELQLNVKKLSLALEHPGEVIDPIECSVSGESLRSLNHQILRSKVSLWISTVAQVAVETGLFNVLNQKAEQ